MRKRFPLTLLAFFALTQAGCLIYSHEIAQTKRAFEAEYPDARFEQKTMLNLGPASLWLAGGLLRLTDREDYAEMRPYLRALRRVKIGIYQTEGLAAPGAVKPPSLPFLRTENWQVAVRTRQPDERVWILYRPPHRGAPLRDLYVLSLNDEELMALRLRGRLDQLVGHYLEEEDLLDGLLNQGDEEQLPQNKKQDKKKSPLDSARTTGSW